MIAWLVLVLAGCCEIFGVAMLNLFSKNKDIKSMLLVVFGFGCSLLCLSYAMQTIPMGVTYAVWTGIGGVGSALIGMMFYNESKEWKRICFMAMIIASVVGLKLTESYV